METSKKQLVLVVMLVVVILRAGIMKGPGLTLGYLCWSGMVVELCEGLLLTCVWLVCCSLALIEGCALLKTVCSEA